jgi:hypothetical protein
MTGNPGIGVFQSNEVARLGLSTSYDILHKACDELTVASVAAEGVINEIKYVER